MIVAKFLHWRKLFDKVNAVMSRAAWPRSPSQAMSLAKMPCLLRRKGVLFA
jgi:hypothetical protein